MDQGEQRLIEVFEKSRKKFEHVAYNMIDRINVDDAADIVQDAFLEAWKCRDQVNPINNVDLWVKAFVGNHTMRAIRAWARYNKVHVPMTPKIEANASTAIHPEREVIGKEELKLAQQRNRTILQGAIDKMTLELQKILAMKNRGFPHKKVGYWLGLTEKEVELKIRKINRILKQAGREASGRWGWEEQSVSG